MNLLLWKLVVLLCAAAVSLALLTDLALNLMARLGGFLIGGSRWGWVLLLFVWWTCSFALGIYAASRLGLPPFSMK